MKENSDGKPWALAVKAVIADTEGRHLLLRRSKHCRNFIGVWEWPGGKLEPGENFAAGLAREVHEECGLEVEFTGLAGASEFEIPRLPGMRVVLVCMNARIIGGNLRLSEEHDACEWVAFPALLERPLFEPMKPVIRQLALP